MSEWNDFWLLSRTKLETPSRVGYQKFIVVFHNVNCSIGGKVKRKASRHDPTYQSSAFSLPSKILFDVASTSKMAPSDEPFYIRY